MLTKGINIKVIQEQLGHATIRERSILPLSLVKNKRKALQSFSTL
ncbi:MAG: hypothetical protein RR595_04885 [Lysinibacillus sp.]